MEPPIRSKIFTLDEWAGHGHSLGLANLKTDEASTATKKKRVFFPRLLGNMQALRLANEALVAQAKAGFDLSPAGDWLLDNFHLIDAQLKEVQMGLPHRYYESLPVLNSAPLAGLPRIYSVAWAFVAHTDASFDEQLLAHFLKAYQITCPLSLAELWALPTTLRVVLIENLRRLAERCVAWDVGAGVHDEVQAAEQAADNQSVRHAILSLRAVNEANWQHIVGQSSALTRQLLANAVFAAEDPKTQEASLYAVERLAKESSLSAQQVADALLSLMQNAATDASAAPGYWLQDKGQSTLWRLLQQGSSHTHWRYWRLNCWKRWRLPLYFLLPLLSTVVLTLALLPSSLPSFLPTFWLAPFSSNAASASASATFLGMGFSWLWLGGLLLLLPVSEAVLAVMNRLISEGARPQYLPRLAFEQGIPEAQRVMVVIPCMLVRVADIQVQAHRLYLHYLANPEAQAQFALLTDWQDAATEHTEADGPLLACALQAVKALNDQVDVFDGSAQATSPRLWPRFILLHRHRSFSVSEQCWMGWERKRGKLLLLIHELARNGAGTGARAGAGAGTGAGAGAGAGGAAFMDFGRFSRQADQVAHVLTLDSDTELPPGRLRDLVGVAAHPLNCALLSADRACIERGYGILQPRMVLPLASATEDTYFRWLFADQCGMDPYNSVSSEVYQDLFAQGSFAGKGLLNVAALDAVLGGAHSLPTDAVLSHDLLEGALARCATVSDISLIEDAPSHPDVAASRLHRWIRGDWQLCPLLWQSLLPASQGRRKLSALNNWKLFDNLRRSLVPVACFALLLSALLGHWISVQRALSLVLAVYLAGPMLGALAALIPSRRDMAMLYFLRKGLMGFGRILLGGLWHLAMLPQQSILAIDAVLRTGYRLLVSRRHLLQWTTAASAQRSANSRFGALLRQHALASAIGLALVLASGVLNTGAQQAWALVLGLLWAGNPFWIYAGSWARHQNKGANLTPQEHDYLSQIARETWTLFERTVTPEERYLPPDNLQTWPSDMVAHRTSPTNIGLYMLSACCARAFGWIDVSNLLKRLEDTYSTLLTLQRHEGHFFNWYQTQTGEPLLPQYVSTVDSGNLSGCLLAVAASCLEMAQAAAPLQNGERERLRRMAQSLESLAWAPQYEFLYHRKRQLLHIGYRVADQQLDANFYDLLSSESRLTSALAIAKGDVPAKHWSMLGRPFYAQGVHVGTRSWSGSMFEYLMPSLLLDEPRHSVLYLASQMALREQMAFARELNLPWGMSESAYAQTDDTQAYQYGPQGVPRLALRRSPAVDLVVAPYATALAAQIAPRLAIENFKHLETYAARTSYGFMEALDFSPERQTLGETINGRACVGVQTYMAHHQGMTIVALANVLLNGAPRRWGMANAHVQAVASIFHESMPAEIASRFAPIDAQAHLQLIKMACHHDHQSLSGAATAGLTQILSNGRYSVVLRPNGAGYSCLDAKAFSRWRDDALRDAHGSFFYLRRQARASEGLFSLTQHPAAQEGAVYSTVFHPDSACFEAAWPDLHTRVSVWLSPIDHIEFRQIEVFNLTDESLDLTLFSVFEVSLSTLRADEAHPAFANLFLQAQYSADRHAIVWTRKPRLEGERALHCVHFLIQSEGDTLDAGAVQVQLDRARWQGRHRPLARPLADFSGQTELTGLDPISAMSLSLHLLAHGKKVLTFATAAGASEEGLQSLLDQYQAKGGLPPVAAAATAAKALRDQGQSPPSVSADTALALQAMSTALVSCITPNEGAGAHDQPPPDGSMNKRWLWRLGVSGDHPLLLVSISSTQGLGLVHTMLKALRWWAWCQLPCDLVLINTEPTSYLMPLQRELAHLLETYKLEEQAQNAREPGEGSQGRMLARLHVWQESQLSQPERHTLKALARLHWVADGRSLSWHVQHGLTLQRQVAVPAKRQNLYADPPTHRLVDRILNGPSHRSDEAQDASEQAKTGYLFRGQFERTEAEAAEAEGVEAAMSEHAAPHDFSFQIQGSARPAKPWINVLANPQFGAQVSDAGSGYSWALNSRLNQLTAWSNDPVLDTPSEWFLLQDLRSRALWSLTPTDPSDTSSYRVTHGMGYSRFEHRREDLVLSATWCVDADLAVKQVQVHIQNLGPWRRKLRLLGLVEWVLGAGLADRMTVHTAKLDASLAVLATQCEHSAGFGGGTAFFALPSQANDVLDWTCDRSELFDANGRLSIPDAFTRRAGSGLDPCAALSCSFVLGPQETREAVFLLGYAANAELAKDLLKQAAPISPPLRRQAVQAHWNDLLGKVVVKTPDPCLTPWSTVGCCIKPWCAGCGPRPVFIRPGEPLVFAINCKTVWL
jgi:cyclic beta-1,2-glucan synthetase